MNEIIFLVDEAPEGGYIARALGESIFTEADDIGSLHNMIRDAVRCHFEEREAPKIIRLHFTKDLEREYFWGLRASYSSCLISAIPIL